MSKEGFSHQSESDAFDRNLEAMRIVEVKQDLGFPVEEVASNPVTLTPDQYGQLHAWDVFIEDITPKLEADRAKAHEITLWEKRQFGHE